MQASLEQDADNAYEFVIEPSVQQTLMRVMMQLAAMKDSKKTAKL
jgi:hypothetical protein